MEFQDVVARRRMVRHNATEPLDRAVLERIALTAQRAPSAGFSQGQRLLVVTDPESAGASPRTAASATTSSKGFGPWISQAPALFIPCVSAEIDRARYREPDKVADEAAYHALYGQPAETELDDDDWPVPQLVGGHRLHRDARPAGSRRRRPRRRLRQLGRHRRPPPASSGIPADFVPVGVIPVGRKLPDLRSRSLKRGWLPAAEFLRWETWGA